MQAYDASGTHAGSRPRHRPTKEVREAGALVLDDVTVSFDGFRALDGLTLVVDPGELRCIIGPNGAGKTTMMDVITGKTRPDRGSVRLGGSAVELTELSEHQIARLGVGRKFQRPTVFGQHTVLDNLELAIVRNRSVWATLFCTLTPRERLRIDEVLELVQLQDERTRLAGAAHGQKQWLEIGMLLAQEPQVIMLDEPVAGMTRPEAHRTSELIVSAEGETRCLSLSMTWTSCAVSPGP